MHEPAEKNLKHKTDVMSWSDVDWRECDLNFRSPESENLSVSLASAYAKLALACCVGTLVGIVSMRYLAPLVGPLHLHRTVAIAAIVTALIAVGYYRPLPKQFPSQRSWMSSLGGGASVLLLLVALKYGLNIGAYGAGALVFLGLGVPACMMVADLIAGQMIHWLTADPGLERNAMVTWRNAWCGRFATEHTDKLQEIGVHETRIAQLRDYWRVHAKIVTASGISFLVGTLLVDLVARHGLGSMRVGPVIAVIWVGWLVGLAMDSFGAPIAEKEPLDRALGHWFLYEREGRQPPWALQSLGTNPLVRLTITYAAAGGTSFGLFLLGGARSDWPNQTVDNLASAPLQDVLVHLAVVSLAVPAGVLLIWIIVMMPLLSTVEKAIEESCHEND